MVQQLYYKYYQVYSLVIIILISLSILRYGNCRRYQQYFTQFQKQLSYDGFLIFDSKCAICFIGNVLVNYKGLRVIKFQPTQLFGGQFNPQQFQNLCEQVTSQENPQNLEQCRQKLFAVLKQKYPQCLNCVITGELQKSTGELVKYSKGNLTALLF